jgi:hypothetical protein
MADIYLLKYIHTHTKKKKKIIQEVPGIHQCQDISNHALQDKMGNVAPHMVLVQLQSRKWCHPQRTH